MIEKSRKYNIRLKDSIDRMCDTLCDLVPFVVFKNREKYPIKEGYF